MRSEVTRKMYVSRLVIRNYRSIKHIDISLDKGMNIIVGKNNSGKSKKKTTENKYMAVITK